MTTRPPMPACGARSWRQDDDSVILTRPLIDRHPLAAIDAGAALRIPAHDQHPVLRDRGAVEPDKRRSLHVVRSPFAPDVLPGCAIEDREAWFELVPRELLGQALHVNGLRAADRNRRIEHRDRDLRAGG